MSDPMAHPAVTDLETLVPRLKHLRSDRITVFTNGCFDLLHPGHVDLLARAKFMGDILIVGLNSDESVRRLNKGPGRPVTPLAERAFVLAHLESVDFVVPFEEDTPYELIKAIEPKALIKGGDWPVDQIVGRDIVESYGGLVCSLPLLPGYSTTSLLHRLRSTG